MANLRLHKAPSGGLSGLIWLAIGLVLFGFLYLGSMPGRSVLQERARAGPDGVIAFFPTPESAVKRINQMLEQHAWSRLARYYDRSQSKVTNDQLRSGAYFAGNLAVPPEGPRLRPFPPGWRFLYAEPAHTENIVRVVVAPPGEASPEPDETQSFYLQRFPEGYRILPPDAPVLLPTTPAAPR